MVFRIGKLLEEGKLKVKGLVSILRDHEKRIDDLESSSGSGYDDTEVKADITALETAIGDESTEGSILARIKALEDTP